MNGTAQRPPQWRTPDDLGAEVGRQLIMTDDITSELLLMVVQLEQIAFAPWWRRAAARRRWRRDVAASIRQLAHGGDFTERRMEAIGTGWISRDRGRHRAA